MKIAIPYENGYVFQHFGHTKQFKIYEIENNHITNSQIITTNGEGHSALANLLHSLNVDTLICGGIGEGARMALSTFSIRIFNSVIGTSDDAVNAFLKNKLQFNSQASCHHKHHSDEECDHHCCPNSICKGVK